MEGVSVFEGILSRDLQDRKEPALHIWVGVGGRLYAQGTEKP